MATDVAPTGSRYYFDISFAAPFTAPFATFFTAAPIGPQPSSSFSLFVMASFFASGGCAATLCFLVVIIFLLFLAIDLSLAPFRTRTIFSTSGGLSATRVIAGCVKLVLSTVLFPFLWAWPRGVAPPPGHLG